LKIIGVADDHSKLREETMKMHLVALVGLAISFALPTFAQQTNTVDPQTLQQLDAKSKRYDEAVNNNDAETLAALFTKDAVLIEESGPVYGREAIKKHYADLFQNVHFSSQIPGFVAFYLVDAGDGVMISTSVFQDQRLGWPGIRWAEPRSRASRILLFGPRI
jgi:hypothetical protein